MNGFNYILFFFDRIYRIYWIFYSLFLDEIKNTHTRVQKYYRLEQNSKVPTIFVYPAGLIAADGKYSWYERSDPRDRLRDYDFFDALLEQFSSSYFNPENI